MIARVGRLSAVALSVALTLFLLGGEAFAKNGLDDSIRPDDSGGSNSGSSSSGSSGGSSSGSSGSSGGSQISGSGPDGYDRGTDSHNLTASEHFQSALDARTRNERDHGDRFR